MSIVILLVAVFSGSAPDEILAEVRDGRTCLTLATHLNQATADDPNIVFVCRQVARQ